VVIEEEEVWVQYSRSLSTVCTNCRRLDRDVPSRRPASLPSLQQKSDSQQSSPSFSATQSRVSTRFPLAPLAKRLGKRQPPNLSTGTAHSITHSTSHPITIRPARCHRPPTR
jgi:hypothetical protein